MYIWNWNYIITIYWNYIDKKFSYMKVSYIKSIHNACIFESFIYEIAFMYEIFIWGV